MSQPTNRGPRRPRSAAPTDDFEFTLDYNKTLIKEPDTTAARPTASERFSERYTVGGAFEVEDPTVAPTVLIVTDQATVGVRRERCLSRAAQPEEECDVTPVPHVRGAVHGEDSRSGSMKFITEKMDFLISPA